MTNEARSSDSASDLNAVMEAAKHWQRQHEGHWAGQFQAIRDTREELEQAIRAYGEQRERKGRIEIAKYRQAIQWLLDAIDNDPDIDIDTFEEEGGYPIKTARELLAEAKEGTA